MEFLTSQRGSGCAGGACSLLHGLWTVLFVLTRAGHLSRQMMLAGLMLCVPCGYQKSVLPIQ